MKMRKASRLPPLYSHHVLFDLLASGSFLGTRRLLGTVLEMMFRNPGLIQNHLTLFIAVGRLNSRFL